MHEVGAPSGSSFLEYVVHVELDGSDAQSQSLSDLPVRQAGTDQKGNFALAASEPLRPLLAQYNAVATGRRYLPQNDTCSSPGHRKKGSPAAGIFGAPSSSGNLYAGVGRRSNVAPASRGPSSQASEICRLPDLFRPALPVCSQSGRRLINLQAANAGFDFSNTWRPKRRDHGVDRLAWRTSEAASTTGLEDLKWPAIDRRDRRQSGDSEERDLLA